MCGTGSAIDRCDLPRSVQLSACRLHWIRAGEFNNQPTAKHSHDFESGIQQWYGDQRGDQLANKRACELPGGIRDDHFLWFEHGSGFDDAHKPSAESDEPETRHDLPFPRAFHRCQ